MSKPPLRSGFATGVCGVRSHKEKTMSDQNGNTMGKANDSDFEALNAKLEILSLKLDKQSLTTDQKSEAKKAWWTTAIEILGLPALVVAILFQVSQTTSNIGVPEKTAAETAKIRTEELKARAELEQLIDDLAEKKGQGIAEYRNEIEQTIPKLEETIEKLSAIQKQSNKWSIERLFALYIVLWIVYVGVGLVFEIISHVWSALLSSASNYIYGLRTYDEENHKPVAESKRKKIERLQKIMPWVHSLLGPLPYLAEWAIRLSIFVALLIPFFDQILGYLGSSYSFESFYEAAKELDLAKLIAQLKTLLPGQGF